LITSWKGKPLLPTRSAQDEMFDNDITLSDVEHILETGFDCARSKREKNKLEKCIQKGRKILKVVIADTGNNLIIIHVGSFTASKKKLLQLKRK
jgi:hypothetical protein